MTPARPAAADPFALGDMDGKGPALLCVHGLTGTPADVRPLPELHEELGFACLGPLLPGHGTTVEDLARRTRDEWLDAVVAGYERLAATHERVYVLGLSLGGLLALRLCALRPLAGALLLATPLDLGPVRSTLLRCFGRFVPWVPRNPGMRDPEARARDMGYRRMPIPAVLELMRIQQVVLSELAGLRVPLRLLYSRGDATVNCRDAERIAREATSTRVEVEYLEHSGHVLTLDLERDRVMSWIRKQLISFEEVHRRG